MLPFQFTINFYELGPQSPGICDGEVKIISPGWAPFFTCTHNRMNETTTKNQNPFKMIFINRADVEKAIEAIQNDTELQEATKNIKCGTFERDPENKDYRDRAIYTKALRNCLSY